MDVPDASRARRIATVADKLILSERFVPLCLLAGLSARVLWIAIFDPTPVSDFGWYYARALGLAAGAGYSVDGVPTAYWPVGYPAALGAMLRLFGPSPLVGRVFNVLLSVGILALVHGIALRLFHSVRTARWTLLTLSFYPDQIAFTSLLASETLSLFTLLLGVFLLLGERRTARNAAWAGFVFGLSCMVRPHMIAVPAVLVAVSMSGCRCRARHIAHLRRLFITYAVFAVTLVPWTIRNYVVLGRAVYVSTNGGIALYIGNNPRATGMYDWWEEMTAEIGSGDECERDRRARDAAIAYMVSHPRETMRLWPVKLFRLYYRGEEGVRRNIEGMIGEISRFGAPQGAGHGTAAPVSARNATRIRWLRNIGTAAQVYYYAVVAAAAGGLLVGLRRRPAGERRFPLHGMFVVLCLTGVHVATFADPRYHFPMIPWLVMYCGAFLCWLVSGSRAVLSDQSW